jgi:hypothetical protein
MVFLAASSLAFGRVETRASMALMICIGIGVAIGFKLSKWSTSAMAAGEAARGEETRRR